MQRYAARRAGLSVTADPCILRDQLQEFSRGYTRMLFTVFLALKSLMNFCATPLYQILFLATPLFLSAWWYD